VQEVKPQTYFSFTWHPYGIDKAVDYSSEAPTLVEFHLEATAVGTLLKVRESGFSKVPAERRALAFKMNDNGWAQQMGNIETYVTQNP